MLVISITIVGADITLGDALKTRAIGSSGDKIVLGSGENKMGFGLPDKFDIKVLKQWSFYNGKLITDDDTQRENSREIIFHFDRGRFSFRDKRHKHYYDNSEVYRYSEYVGSGTLEDGNLNGVVTSKFVWYKTAVHS